jgi:DNA repair exonuclease SbcCD ATPase subunit
VNHVRLSTLQLEGFRSFRTKQEFRLPERGMVMVRGRSGHGKSNFALGISHSLGYSPLPATDLIAWDWETKWGARAGLTVNDQPIYVERGSKFDVVIGGEKITGSAASKNERIVREIGLEPDLLGALTYRPQRTFGLFLSMDDEAKKEFLTKLLDLGKFEREAEAAEKNFPGLTKAAEDAAADRDQQRALVDHLRLQDFPLQSEEEALAAVEETKKLLEAARAAHDTAQAKVEKFKENNRKDAEALYQAALQDVRKIETEFAAEKKARPPLPDVEVAPEENRLQDLLDRASGLLKKLQTEDRFKQQGIEAQRTSIQQKLWSERQIVGSSKKLEAQLADARHRLEHLTQNTSCPTCTQKWLGGAEKERLISAVRAEITQHEESIKLLDRSRKEIEVQEALLTETVFTPNPKIEQMLQAKSKAEQQLTAARTKAAGAREQAQTNYAANDATWREMIATAKSQAERQRSQVLENSRANVQILEESMRGVAQELARMVEAHQSAGIELAGIQAQNRTQRANQQKRDRDLKAAEAVWFDACNEHVRKKSAEAEARDFAALTRTYLDKIFDEVLVEIASQTNDVLVRVPNVQHITFGFKSEVETKTTGKKKAKITPIVHIDGVQRPFDGLSGGQKSVVELATDIAIRRVVTNRRQVHIGWLLLDEAFDGLGKIEKEACMEVLQAAAQDDLILVVDHATEFKDMFNQFIDIEMVEGESRVQ